MNIYTKIKQITDFTETEQTFCQFIIDHPQDLIDYNVKQIAQKSYVSVSTIYRVIEKLGLSGLSQLKMLVSSQREAYLHEQKDTDYNYPFEKTDTQHQIMTKMLSLYQQTLASTINLIDLDVFLKVVQVLDNANKITIFPSVGNVFMAESFQQNMLEIGVDVNVIQHSYYQHWNSCSAHQGDVVIVISYANRTPGLIETMQILKENGATIVLISSTSQNALAQFADHHLYFCSYEDSEEKIASFSSRVSLQYLLDCLYACYFNRNYEKHLQHKITNYID